MMRTKPYIVNRNFFGLELKLRHVKSLIDKKITKTFPQATDITIDQYKQLFLEYVDFKDGYFKTLEKKNNEQLCITPVSDTDKQYLVLFISKNNKHTAHFINVQDVELRSNIHVINVLRNNNNFSLVNIEKENLNAVTISYDLKSKRENLIATYEIPGGKIPFYIHKTH